MPRAPKNKAGNSTASLCSICNSNPIKYHCPIDRVGYCSVPCFKTHKAESCSARSTGSASPSTIPAASALATEESVDVPVKQSTSLHTDEKQEPIIALSSLMWPPDPEEEGLNALDDPLNRDEPKPLLHSELLAIATSVPLRQMLSTHPFLKDLLTDLSRIPNNPPRHPQTNRIKDIMGMGEEAGVPKALYYRPGEENDGRSLASGNYAIGRTSRALDVGESERSALLEFNDLIKRILAEERLKRNASRTL